MHGSSTTTRKPIIGGTIITEASGETSGTPRSTTLVNYERGRSKVSGGVGVSSLKGPIFLNTGGGCLVGSMSKKTRKRKGFPGLKERRKCRGVDRLRLFFVVTEKEDQAQQ